MADRSAETADENVHPPVAVTRHQTTTDPGRQPTASGSLVALSSAVSVAAGPGETDEEGVAFGGAEEEAEADAGAEAEEVPDGPEVRGDAVAVAVAEEDARPLALGFLVEGDGRAVGTVTAARLAEADDGPEEGVEVAEFPFLERPLFDCSPSLEVALLPGISVSGAKGVPPMKANPSTMAYPKNMIPATTPARLNRRALRPEESTNTGPSELGVRTRRRARRAGSARPSATGCDFMTAR
ncbi:hypothetical protein ACWY4P_09510 [Streptomyces sp. LZ34]